MHTSFLSSGWNSVKKSGEHRFGIIRRALHVRKHVRPIWGDPRKWSDITKPELTIRIMNILSVIILMTFLLAVLLSSRDILLLIAFGITPFYALISFVVEGQHRRREHKIRETLVELLSDAESALWERDLGTFEWSFWTMTKVFLQKTTDPSNHAILKLLQRSTHVGHSEQIRPHLARTQMNLENVASSVNELRLSLKGSQNGEIAKAIANLFASYVYSSPLENVSYVSKVNLDRRVLDTLRLCVTDMQETRIGRAIGRISNLLDDIPMLAGPSDSNFALLIGNWLLQKFRELERVKPSDTGLIWLSRFELMARHVHYAVKAYEDDDPERIMLAIADSYDRAARKLRIFS